MMSGSAEPEMMRLETEDGCSFYNVSHDGKQAVNDNIHFGRKTKSAYNSCLKLSLKRFT
jgi:hypothetical protein